MRFGRFELDRTAGELYRDGRRVRLQEHPRQVLVALLERPGELVTREELRERLWKSDTFVDFEHGLNTAVKKARQALGDSADSPKFIETLARRGYRFIADVQPTDTAAAAVSGPPPVVLPVLAAREAFWITRRTIWAGTLLLIIAGAVVAWLATHRENSLAVMPLRVLTQNESDAGYLGVGIADAITTRLANTRDIALRPTSAVLPFKDAQSDPARVARSLGVRHLLVGTIQPMLGSYHINLQLVRANGVLVRGFTFDEPATGLLQLQDRVADEVAAALGVAVSTRQSKDTYHATQPAAYDKHLRGRALMVNYSESKMLEAIKYFEEAVKIDPNYAAARASIATACAWFSVRYAHGPEAIEWGKRADSEARAALTQDGSLAEAHLAIAHAAGTTYGGFNWGIVLDRSAAALTLNPSLDLAHEARMRAYYHLGLLDRMREEGRLAQELNRKPNVEFARLDVVGDLVTGQYQAAVEKSRTLLSRTDMPAVSQYLGLGLYYTGDGAGARTTLMSIMRDGRPDVRAQASLASIEAALGLHQQARTRVNEIEHGLEMDHHIAYSLGAAMAQLGETSASLTWLQRAIDTGFPCYPWFEKDTLLDPVRREPDFVRLLERLRLQHTEARRRAS
jgi:DNA-binding winged helix-turn-helix (wHTH) protein/TolB-like protein